MAPAPVNRYTGKPVPVELIEESVHDRENCREYQGKGKASNIKGFRGLKTTKHHRVEAQAMMCACTIL